MKKGKEFVKNKRKGDVRLRSAALLAILVWLGEGAAFGLLAVMLLVLAFARLSAKKKEVVETKVRFALSKKEPTYRIAAEKIVQEKEEKAIAPQEESAATAKEMPALREKVSAAEAHRLLSDEVAVGMVERESAEESTAEREIVTNQVLGESPAAKESLRLACGKKHIVNVDTLSAAFERDAVVDIEGLKEKGLIPKKATAIKVLARGSLDKPLVVKANDFSADAVKMIVLTGGKAVRV